MGTSLSCTRRGCRPLALVLACLLTLPGGPGLSEEDRIDPLARRVLGMMSAYLTSAPAFTVDANAVTVEPVESARPFRLAARVGLGVRRPDRLYADIQSVEVHTRFLFDGERMSLYDLNAGIYAAAETPGDIDSAVDSLEAKYGVFVPLAHLLRNDGLFDDAVEDVTELAYLRMEEVDGVTCHHVYGRQEGLSWEIWIEDGIRMVPRRLVLHFAGGPAYTATLSGWDFSPHLPDVVFQGAPSEATRVPLQEGPGDAR